MKTLVYGSLNIDLIFYVDHIVIPGETISSFSFFKGAGGKGANQAGQLWRKPEWKPGWLGKSAKTELFSLSSLNPTEFTPKKVVQYEGPSGQALIQVEESGQNSIIVYAGPVETTK